MQMCRESNVNIGPHLIIQIFEICISYTFKSTISTIKIQIKLIILYTVYFILNYLLKYLLMDGIFEKCFRQKLT